MNTNELADELDNMLKAIGLTDNRVPTMLRQQQAEIETLKAGKIRAYDNGVEDGKKSNTNPAKTLTDEEIGDFTHRMVLCCQVHPSSADINVLGLKFIVEDILRKEQEK
jgi:hypothetical protein